VSTPLELYERPANEFVAGFVGVSNLIERDGERMTIRPEKIELLDPSSAATDLQTEHGRIVDVSYAGAVTRFTVALERGETLQLVRQNVESASAGALPAQGNEVLVGWRPEHAAAVGGKSTKQEVAP
jgi:putative spermidine/putrescine transport system ATP-binding protein